MQGMQPGFISIHSDFLMWVVPLGAIGIAITAIISIYSFQRAMVFFLSGIVAIALASASYPLATSVYNYFHG